jgi:hypothetical protein
VIYACLGYNIDPIVRKVSLIKEMLGKETSLIKSTHCTNKAGKYYFVFNWVTFVPIRVNAISDYAEVLKTPFTTKLIFL